MKAHIRQISRNALYHLHNIGKVRQYLHTSVTEQLFTMLVMLRIDYCNALLAGLPQSSLVPLQRVQNCAARVLTGTRKSAHITPVLMKLHWLPVKFRVMYKLCILVCKCLNGIGHEYLVDLLHTSSSSRTTRLSCDQTRLQCVNTRLCIM